MADLDELMADVALASHDLGDTVTAIQARLAQSIPASVRSSLLVQLALLKSDQRELEDRLSELAANRDAFQPPSDDLMATLGVALDDLGKVAASAEMATELVQLAGKVVAAARSALASAKG